MARRIVGRFPALALVSSLVILAVTTGCTQRRAASGGGSANLATAFQGVQSIPDVGSAITSAAASTGTHVVQARGAVDLMYSGTPPKLSEIGTTNHPSVDQAFFNGLLATINTQTTAVTSAQADQFYGKTEGGSGGIGACLMAMDVEDTVLWSQFLQANMCMLREMVNIGGVTVAPALASGQQPFGVQATDKVWQVAFTSLSAGSDKPTAPVDAPSLFIKVYGSATAGANVYKASLWVCMGDSGPSNDGSGKLSETVRGFQTYVVDYAKKQFSQTAYDAISLSVNNTISFGLTFDAGLSVGTNGKVIFDPKVARTLSLVLGYPNAIFKSSIGIDSTDHITGKRLWNVTSGNYTWTEKAYASMLYSATDLEDLTFYQGAFEASDALKDFKSAFAWKDKFYAVDSSIPEVASTTAALASDTYFTDKTAPAAPPELATVNCKVVPDYVATIDPRKAFSEDTVSSCMSALEGMSSICYSSDVYQAWDKVAGTAPIHP